MDTLSITQLSRIYHLPNSQRELEQYFNRMINEAVGEQLEVELSKQGMDSDEEICIRFVHIPLRFTAGKSNEQTINQWSEHIAAHVKSAVLNDNNNIVRYPSRLHGLMDFAHELSVSRVDRAWAWKQLNLLTALDEPSLLQARSELVVALAKNPECIFPVFITLAKSERLLSLLNTFSVTENMCLLKHIFQTASINEQWWHISWDSIAAETHHSIDVSTYRSGLLDQSCIAKYIFQHAQYYDVNTTQTAPQLGFRFWSILIALEVEPTLFSRSRYVITSLLINIFNALNTIVKNESKTISDHGQDDEKQQIGTLEQKENIVEQYSSSKTDIFSNGDSYKFSREENQIESFSSKKEGVTANDIGTPLLQDETHLDNIVGNNLSRHQAISTTQTTAIENHRVNTESETSHAKANQSSNGTIENSTDTHTISKENDSHYSFDKTLDSISLEQLSLQSQWGGLLYLLPLLNRSLPEHNQLSIIESLIEADELNNRSLQYILYHFLNFCFFTTNKNGSSDAISLSDPVLRLLCTMPIRLDEKTELKPLQQDMDSPLTDTETRIIHLQSERLLQDLQTLFLHLELSVDRLWYWLCQRDVELEIDDMWVNIIYSLESLDTDIRRTGLDVNPNYVPWIGKIIKFRYISKGSSKGQGGTDYGR